MLVLGWPSEDGWDLSSTKAAWVSIPLCNLMEESFSSSDKTILPDVAGWMKVLVIGVPVC
jgi:hypothetical protein